MKVDPFENQERVREIASEYRVAYRQLQHAEKRLHRLIVEGERDCDLARQRYEAARAAFLGLALDEEDEYLVDDDAGAGGPGTSPTELDRVVLGQDRKDGA